MVVVSVAFYLSSLLLFPMLSHSHRCRRAPEENSWNDSHNDDENDAAAGDES